MAVVNIRRLFVIGPRDTIAGLLDDLHSSRSAVVQVDRAIAVVTDGPIADRQALTDALQLTSEDRLSLLEG